MVRREVAVGVRLGLHWDNFSVLWIGRGVVFLPGILHAGVTTGKGGGQEYILYNTFLLKISILEVRSQMEDLFFFIWQAFIKYKQE